MAEQQAPHLRWVETGRQWIAKNVGLKRGRAALIAPTRLAPGASPGLERVELAELAELAEMEREEAMHFLVVRHRLVAQREHLAHELPLPQRAVLLLERLDLSMSCITDAGCAAFAAVLRSGALPELKEVDLRDATNEDFSPAHMDIFEARSGLVPYDE